MPQLPTAEQLGVVQPQPNSAVPSVGGEAGIVGEAQARVGAEVTQLGNTVLDVHDELAYANANSMLWQAKVALDQKYKNDPDPATAAARYEAELSGVSQQAGGLITRPRMRVQFQDMASRFVIARGVETVQNQADAALTNQAVAKLGDSADTGVTAFANTNDQHNQYGIAQSYYGQVDAMVKARTLSATDGEKLKKDFIHRAVYANIAAAADGTPAGTAEMIRRWNSFNGVEQGNQPPPAAGTMPVAPGAGDDYRNAIIKGESGGDVSKVNPKSGAAGRYQFMPATAAQYGLTVADLTNPDPKVQAKVDTAWQKFTADNRAALTTSLGRIPTAAELSLAQQQGAAGAAALLNNPNAKASDIVGQKAVLDNGGTADMTANDFSQHVMGYYGASPAPAAAANQVAGPGAPAMTTQPLPGSMASQLPADVYGRMAMGIQSEINASQAQIDHQQVEAQKAQELKVKQATVDAIQQMLAHDKDPSKPDVDLSTLSTNPIFANDPEALKGLVSFQRSLDHPPTDSGLDKATTQALYRGYLNGTATTDDFQEAFAPKDGSPGKISKANLDFLMGAAKGKDDPAAVATNKLKDKFLSDNEAAIGAPGNAIDSDSKYRFDFDFQQAWDAKIAKGENPRDLVTPGSKDYFGSLANLSHYSQTAADALAAEADKQNPGWLSRTWTALTGGNSAPAIPDDLPSGTVAAGTTRDGRPAFKLPDGKLVAVGAPPAAPAATAAVLAPASITASKGPPTVPSGE